MDSQPADANAQNDISVFRHLGEIPYVSFPMRLDRMLMVVCTSGSISASVDTQSRELGCGDVLALLPGHHIAGCKCSDDFDGFFVTAARARVDRMIPTMKYLAPYAMQLGIAPVIHLADDEHRHLCRLYELMCMQLAAHHRPYGPTALQSLCEVLFFTALGIYSTRLSDTPVQSRREEMLGRFMEILEANYRSERSVKYYADRLFVTPKHLSSVLKEVSGKTAGEWIDQRVILEAKLMLRSTGMNVQEISSALNFANQSFFGKYFKHLTGVSPRAYRSKLSE